MQNQMKLYWLPVRHEDKQIYKNKILNISDKKIIKGIRKKFKIISRKKQNFLQNKLILKSILGKKIFFDL